MIGALDVFIRELESAFTDLTWTRYVSGASLALLLYDHILTFDQELEWMWNTGPSSIKVLFLFNRYTTPLIIFLDVLFQSGRITMSDEFCVAWLFIQALWQSGSALISQLLLGLRITAIWGGKRWTHIFIYIGMTICTLVSFTTISIGLAGVARSFRYSPELKMCFTREEIGPWMWAAFFIPIMVFDAIIFILTVINVIVQWDDHINRGSIRFMMWRDGMLYFFIMFTSELACLLVSALWGFRKTQIIKVLVWVIQNVTIAHMTLNLVEAVHKPDQGAHSQPTYHDTTSVTTGPSLYRYHVNASTTVITSQNPRASLQQPPLASRSFTHLPQSKRKSLIKAAALDDKKERRSTWGGRTGTIRKSVDQEQQPLPLTSPWKSEDSYFAVRSTNSTDLHEDWVFADIPTGIAL